MRCENCDKEIPEVILVHKAQPVEERLSGLAITHRLFCSEECMRQKRREEFEKNNPVRG